MKTIDYSRIEVLISYHQNLSSTLAIVLTLIFFAATSCEDAAKAKAEINSRQSSSATDADTSIEKVKAASDQQVDKIFDFMAERWSYYEKVDRKYLPELHDALILEETSEEFGVGKDSILRIYHSRFSGIDSLAKKQRELKELRVPIDLTVENVCRDESGSILIRIKNNTRINEDLPRINLTCFLLLSRNEKVTKDHYAIASANYQIAFAESLEYGETRTLNTANTKSFFHNPPSSSVSADYQFAKVVGYISNSNLGYDTWRSMIADSASKGETCIPVLVSDLFKI